MSADSPLDQIVSAIVRIEQAGNNRRTFAQIAYRRGLHEIQREKDDAASRERREDLKHRYEAWVQRKEDARAFFDFVMERLPWDEVEYDDAHKWWHLCCDDKYNGRETCGNEARQFCLHCSKPLCGRWHGDEIGFRAGCCRDCRWSEHQGYKGMDECSREPRYDDKDEWFMNRLRKQHP